MNEYPRSAINDLEDRIVIRNRYKQLYKYLKLSAEHSHNMSSLLIKGHNDSFAECTNQLCVNYREILERMEWK